jgi:hypothetical protein
VANEEVHLYTPSAANHTTFGGGFFGGGGERGQNPPNGAVVYYSLKTALKKPGEKKPEEKKAEGGATPAAATPAKEASTEGKEPGQAHPANAPVPPKPEAEAGDKGENAKNAPVTLEILDQKGQVVRKYPPKALPGADAGDDEGFGPRPAERELPTESGLNRFVWDMHYEGATRVPRSPLWAGSTDGPEALPGKYQVRLTVNGRQYTAPLEIVSDPRLKVTQQDLEKQFDLLIKILSG